MRTHSIASRVGALLLILNAGTLYSDIDLQVELPAVRTQLEAMLLADMQVSRADIVELNGAFGILLHAFPKDANECHAPLHRTRDSGTTSILPQGEVLVKSRIGQSGRREDCPPTPPDKLRSIS